MNVGSSERANQNKPEDLFFFNTIQTLPLTCGSISRNGQNLQKASPLLEQEYKLLANKKIRRYGTFIQSEPHELTEVNCGYPPKIQRPLKSTALSMVRKNVPSREKRS